MGNCLSIGGNVLAAAILLASDCVASAATWLGQTLAGAVDRICGSGHNTSRRKVPWHAQRYANAPEYLQGGTQEGLGMLDEAATMAKSTFPIKPAELVEKARAVLASEFGTKEGADASVLADDFQFVAPIVGPLSKGEFMRAFGSFKIRDAIPDIKDNSWFHVDPLEPNRVWFFSRATGTHTGVLNFGGNKIQGTGAEIHSPPQAQSMLFNERGQVYTLTVGYCMDKRIGNTEGLGGVFGILKAVGKGLPFPEAQRLYNPSLRFEAFEHVAKAVEASGYDPTTRKRLPRDAASGVAEPMLGS